LNPHRTPERSGEDVIEVAYRQRLKDGLRHAVLKGLRPEKKPGLIRRSPQLERVPFEEPPPGMSAGFAMR
jgi:hypothetical protein